MPPKAFKPYGTPPPFDFDEYKDSFELWQRQWSIFMALSTINTSLLQADRSSYTAKILLSCLSKPTLRAICSMGLSDIELDDPDIIIGKLRERCNAGRNCHVWRQQFALRTQREKESADGWVTELRDLAQKCEFDSDCCDKCQDTRLLGQIIYGVHSDDVRKKLLQKGAALELDQAITILRTAEATQLQAAHLRQSDSPSIQQVKTKPVNPNSKARPSQQASQHYSRGPPAGAPPNGCWNCGAESFHQRSECPANGKECGCCGKIGHFKKVCSKNTPKPETAGSIIIGSIMTGELLEADVSPAGSDSRVTVSFLPDTGASIDAIPHQLYEQLFNETPLHRAPSRAITATGEEIENHGTFQATVQLGQTANDSSSLITMHVLKDLRQPVLSKATQKKLGVLPLDYPHWRVQSIRINISPQQKAETLKSLMAPHPLIFDGVCHPMAGPPCHFQLAKGAIPSAMRGSRPVAIPLLPKLKTELDSLEDQLVICKVVDPTAWVHPIVIAPKKDGGIRVCVHFTHLNNFIIRPKFETATPFQAVRTIPAGMKFFTVIDALKGYHQVPLDDESAAMTTFSTPFGRYMYRRLPFGICHAGDDYSRRVSAVFDDLPNCRRIIEDILIFSETYEEHVALVRQVFQRAADHQIAINTKKIQFAQPSVLFGGYILSSTGFSPNPELLPAISKFPAPTNITEMRAFHGLCQQMGNFSQSLAAALLPLAPLLKKNYRWEWTSHHESSFNEARKELSSSAELSFYDQALPTALHVDASRLRGLGFVLRQQSLDGKWNVVQAGSRFLSDAVTRYAMIELECLGAAWAMQKCRQFLEGLPSFLLLTDHRPLIPILNEYSLDKLDNPRILRLRLKMQRYSFTARWIPGKENLMADALSRAPVHLASPNDELAEVPPSADACISLLAAITGSDVSLSDPLLKEIALTTATDPVMKALREMILSGFPNDKCNLPLPLRPFWCIRSRLSIDESENLIMLGPRVVIPEAVRREVLDNLLLMHQGATKLRQRARLTMFWPSMDNDIVTAARTCHTCTEYLPSHPTEPLLPHARASRPFEFIHADLGCHNGRDFLILADHFSGWPHVVPFPDKNTSARKIVDVTRSFFSFGAGAPVKLWSDGGPQFASDEFNTFLRDWGISHGVSSAGYSQSNGFAEVSVKSMKKLIRGSWTAGSFNTDEFSKGLLLYRNAPISGGASPAQLVFNRPVRDCLPAHRRAFTPQWQKSAAQMEKTAMHARSLRATHFNKTAHPLPPLAIGDQVVIQNSITKRWSTPGVVVEIGPFRDFLIKIPAGRLFRRNRRFLRRYYTSIARPQHPDSPITPQASATSSGQSPEPSAARTPVPPRRSARINSRLAKI